MVDTTNKFLVGAQGNVLVFMKPVPQRISNEDALLLAAYLVSMVGDDDLWNETLKAVQET